MTQVSRQEPEPFLYPINEAGMRVRRSRSTMYALIREGTIKAVHVGSRTFITHAELLRFVDSLPELPARDQQVD